VCVCVCVNNGSVLKKEKKNTQPPIVSIARSERSGLDLKKKEKGTSRALNLFQQCLLFVLILVTILAWMATWLAGRPSESERSDRHLRALYCPPPIVSVFRDRSRGSACARVWARSPTASHRLILRVRALINT
jgi:hypothetical protein